MDETFSGTGILVDLRSGYKKGVIDVEKALRDQAIFSESVKEVIDGTAQKAVKRLRNILETEEKRS